MRKKLANYQLNHWVFIQKLKLRVNINKVYFKIGSTLIKMYVYTYGVHMRFVGEC